MAPPDINSLSSLTSRTRTPSNPFTMSERSNEISPHHHASAMSLATAASLNNATDSSARRSPSNARGSPRLRGRVPSDRHRSQVLLNLSLNDPTLPSPGEMAFSDQPRRSSGSNFTPPYHDRHLSLGEIHNELEQEQEAQVNRMLGLIRSQQAQLDSLRAAQTGTDTTTSTAVLDDLTPQSERSLSFPSIHPAIPTVPRSQQQSIPRTSQDSPTVIRSPSLLRQDSQQHHWPPSPAESNSHSPHLIARRNSSSRRSSIRERDETAYYQAETANLQRENQMLRLRIRELEKMVNEQQQRSGSHVGMSSEDNQSSIRRSSLATELVMDSGERN